jgi:hypothetical protein
MDDYKKYALGQLENFLHDCMNAETTTAQEIYDVIKSVVEDNYYTYKNSASQAYELLALLNGNGKGHISEYEPSMPPWGHSDLEYHLHYTDEEISAMCDKAEEEQKKTLSYDEAIAAGCEMTADGFWIKESPEVKTDKVVKWQLPVQQSAIDGVDDYYINFPDDLLEAANLKEGDQIEWVDNGDGSYTMLKVTKPLGMEEY